MVYEVNLYITVTLPEDSEVRFGLANPVHQTSVAGESAAEAQQAFGMGLEIMKTLAVILAVEPKHQDTIFTYCGLYHFTDE